MRPILRLIAKGQVEYAYWKWLFITTGRHVFGRGYIFRDAPLWFVKCIANTPPGDKYVKDERMMAYYHAACDELRNRKCRMMAYYHAACDELRNRS